LFLYDTRGRLINVEKENINIGDNSCMVDLSAVSEGLYLLTISDGVNSISRQLLVRK
jgi:hypothetical protein